MPTSGTHSGARPGARRPVSYLLYYPCRHAAYNGAGRHVLGHHCACGDYGVVAYGNPWQYRRVGAYPHVPAQPDWRRGHGAARPGRQSVVQGGEDDVVAYLAEVAYVHAPVVLKLAAGVDEHAFAYVQVLAEVGVERREHLESAPRGVARQLGQQPVDFLLAVVCGVELERQPARFFAHAVHKAVNLGSVERLAGLNVV